MSSDCFAENGDFNEARGNEGPRWWGWELGLVEASMV